MGSLDSSDNLAKIDHLDEADLASCRTLNYLCRAWIELQRNSKDSGINAVKDLLTAFGSQSEIDQAENIYNDPFEFSELLERADSTYKVMGEEFINYCFADKALTQCTSFLRMPVTPMKLQEK